jgi:Lrp/AsnC family leucine-responsive transcriptional regulator
MMATFIRISSAGEKCIKFSKIITNLPEVLECHRITGSDHFIIKVVVSSATHLEVLIDQLVPYSQLTASIVLSSPGKRRQIEQSVTSP